VFQPHQLQRLNLLFNEFVQAFDFCDELILLPSFKVVGREKYDFKKDSNDLFIAIKKQRHKILKNLELAKNFQSAIRIIINRIKQYYYHKMKKNKLFLIVFMGAGDIDENIRRYLKLI